MNFTIFAILGFCAFLPAQSYAYRTGHIYDQFRTLSGLSLRFNETVEKVENDIKNQVNDFKIKINKELETLTKVNISPLIEELTQKGGAFKQCAESLIPECESIEKETSKSFQICVEKDNDELKKFGEKIVDDRKRIAVLSKSYEVDCRKCEFLPVLALIKCLADKTPKYQGIYDAVISSSKSALNDAQEFGTKITTESRSRYQAVLSKKELQVLKLKQQLMLCYKY